MYVILLALMVPAVSGLVDCRLACRSCRENKEVPAMVEVYCSMCEECKERRRDKLAAMSTTIHHDETNFLPDRVRYEEYPPPTKEPHIFGPTTDNIIEKLRKEFAIAEKYPFGHFGDDRYEDDRRRRRPRPRQWARQWGRQAQDDEYEYSSEDESYQRYRRLRQEDIPEGCPTPPICSDDEEEPSREVLTTKPETTATTTSTTTTTTKKPCPPIRQCKKKRRPTRQPCCMPMCCPMMPCPAPPCGQACPEQRPCQPSTAETIAATVTTSTQSTLSNDYVYMYVGVPKNVIKQQ